MNACPPIRSAHFALRLLKQLYYCGTVLLTYATTTPQRYCSYAPDRGSPVLSPSFHWIPFHSPSTTPALHSHKLSWSGVLAFGLTHSLTHSLLGSVCPRSQVGPDQGSGFRVQGPVPRGQKKLGGPPVGVCWRDGWMAGWQRRKYMK